MIKRTVALAAIAALSVGMATAQEDPMAMMAELGSPGEQHEQLAKMVGDWTYAQKMWMVPGSPPMESTGAMTAEAMLDGRFVKATWSAEVMGMQFTGVGINGYDKAKQQFTSTWMDSMMTGTMMFTGQCTDDACASTEMSTSFEDPASGNEMTMRMVTTWTSGDSFEIASYIGGSDGNEMQNMAITATRSE